MAMILVSTQSMFDVSCVIDNYYRLSLLYIHVLYIDGYRFIVFRCNYYLFCVCFVLGDR